MGYLLYLVAFIGWDLSSSANEAMPSQRIAGVDELSSENIVVASRMVDGDGADIAVGDIGSPIDGLIVHIPSQAMEHAACITLGYRTKSVPVRAGRACGTVVTLRADTISKFEDLITIEVHYRVSQPPTLVIPYSLDAKGRLHVMNIETFDASNARLVFYTASPGEFTWVYE
jgi:hypothetical protein